MHVTIAGRGGVLTAPHSVTAVPWPQPRVQGTPYASTARSQLVPARSILFTMERAHSFSPGTPPPCWAHIQSAEDENTQARHVSGEMEFV